MSTLSDRSPLAQLAHILHAAASFGPQAWDRQGDRSPSNTASERSMSEDLNHLFRLLNDRNIAYLLVGGVAMLRYVEGRNTDDIDLIIATDSLPQIPELVIADRSLQTCRAHFGKLRVDLLFTNNPVFRLAHTQFATTHRFAEVDVRCATAEGLVLLKLYALPSLYRQGLLQRAALYETDIVMLALAHHPQFEPLLGLLQKHLDEGEMAELEKIASEIQARIKSMRR